MAIGRITYANKVDYRQEGQDDKYKITAENMNEIKRVFNNSAEAIEKGLSTIDENVKKTNDARDLAKQYMEQASQDALTINGTANGIIEKVTTEDGYAQINDSSNRRLNNMIIRGNSEQIKTTGKNLLLIYKQTQTVNGITLTYDNDNKVIIANGTATSWTNIALGVFDFKKGITYKFVGCPKGGSVDTLYHIEPNGGLFFDIGNGATYTPSEDKLNTLIYFVVTKGVVLNNLVIKPMITTDLNVTYDDYEPYTGGKPSPSPEYPQEIKAVNELSGVMCGKNLINPATVANDYFINDQNGKLTPALKCNATDYIKIQPNTNYYISKNPSKKGCWGAWYDKNKKHVKAITGDKYGTVVTSPSNAHYIRLTLNHSGTNPNFANNMYLYRCNTDNLLFERFFGSNLNYTLQNPLYKIGDVYDYIDFNRGKIVRNVGIIEFDGSSDENWLTAGAYTSTYRSYYNVSLPRINRRNTIKCNKLRVHPNNSLWNAIDELYISVGDDGALYINIPNIESCRPWLQANPITVYYQLATPTEEDIPAELLSQLKELQTYVTTTNVMFEASDVYPIVDLEYIADTKTYIDNKFKELAEVIITSTSEEEL